MSGLLKRPNLMAMMTCLDWQTLRTIVYPKRGLAVLVAVLSFLETVVLTFGVGLVYPIVAVVVGGGAVSGAVAGGNVLMRYFPTGIDVAAAFGLLLVIFAAKSALSLWRIWAMRNLAETLRVSWSSTIADSIYQRRLKYHDLVRDGTKIGTIAREPKLAARCIGGSVTYFVNLLAILFLSVLAVYASWEATLLFAVIGGGAAVVLRLTLLKYIERLGELRLRTNHRFIAEIVETIGAIKDVKALGLECVMRAKMDVESRELAHISVLSNFYTSIPAVLTDFIAITVFLVFVYVLLLAHEGDVAALLPQVALFFAVLVKLFSSGSQVVTARATILANIASLNHILSVLRKSEVNEEQETLTGGEPIAAIETDIVFQDISFSYEPDLPVLNGVSLSLPRGKVTYVVGPSGIGKTTLVDLLLRYYVPKSGSVRANGRDIADFNLKAWRRRIGYVGQDALLFSGTIRENITLGDPAATDEKVRWAAEVAGAAEFIGELAQGYDTVVGEKGVTLSGGQRMRIAIARAAVRQPDLVIIDEGTARFELNLERQMVQALRSLPNRPTVIIITHRYQSTEFGDQLIDFKQISGVGAGRLRSPSPLSGEEAMDEEVAADADARIR